MTWANDRKAPLPVGMVKNLKRKRMLLILKNFIYYSKYSSLFSVWGKGENIARRGKGKGESL